MADEAADISNKEQLVVCIRWVDENFAVHEDFIAMYPLERTTADHIVAVLKNCLISLHLRIENARGQSVLRWCVYYGWGKNWSSNSSKGPE